MAQNDYFYQPALGLNDMTNTDQRGIAYFYWFAALSYLFSSELFAYALHGLHKAMPILFLAASSLILTRGTLRLWLVFALFASSCGDMLLASELEQSFIYGLAAFAFAHLCYSLCFIPWFFWSTKPL